MTAAQQQVLKRVLKVDGPVRVLIYKADGRGLDGSERFIAESLRYGHSASGRSEDEALVRLFKQVVAYILRCEQIELSMDGRLNLAPQAVRDAFVIASPFRHVPDPIRAFVQEFAEVKAKGPESEFAMGLLMDVSDISEMQRDGEPLEDVVDRALADRSASSIVQF